MPQLDYYIFVSQLSWLFFFLIGLYMVMSEWVLPILYEWKWVRKKIKENEGKAGEFQKRTNFRVEKGESLFSSYVLGLLEKVQEPLTSKLKKK